MQHAYRITPIEIENKIDLKIEREVSNKIFGDALEAVYTMTEATELNRAVRGSLRATIR